MAEVFKSHVYFAEPAFYKSAAVPCLRQIGIERKRLINQRGAGLEFANNTGTRKPATRERKCVILSQFCRPSRQPGGFGNLLLTVDHPAIRLALSVAPCGHAVGRGETGIKLYGPVERS